MKKEEIKINHVYNVSVSGYVCPVRIDKEFHDMSGNPKGWYGTNLLTMRKVRIKTAARCRSEKDRTMYMSPESADFLARNGMK